MLTRLKVHGFKNLMDVDVRFGPFTCIAGTNGVGKSNLFDAIRFLSALSDMTLLEAASSVRDEGGKAPDVRGLFFRTGNKPLNKMFFEAEMIVPEKVIDDFGKEGTAKITILRYVLELKYRAADSRKATTIGGDLEIVREELVYIQKGEALKHLLFKPSKEWRESAVIGASRTPFISTVEEDGRTIIKLHQDGSGGRPSHHVAESLPRTLLSSGSASESPTVLCARREMASWRLLQLEPSRLRQPSEFNSPNQISPAGDYLSATLYHMAQSAKDQGVAPDEDSVYCQVSNRLSELIGHVDLVRVDRDDKRELFTLMLRETRTTEFPARALSDGTLRFLALAVIEMDIRSGGLICLEEPENGIHPVRIPAILRLLKDVATDVKEPIEPGNPLRQVIVNTHSPAVVSEVPDDSLIVAEVVETIINGNRGNKVRFSCLDKTWRSNAPEKPPIVAKGKLLSYLNPRVISSIADEELEPISQRVEPRFCKVRNREDLQQLSLPLENPSCR
ncbi:AAA family ATPase [Desulfosarcina ovata]|uniref:ATPase AAA-type core domain-containing protein n=1 Tax=Desulfosarcina ovata subsp. ovata TaxID=2752305 RepID=A0A5K8AA37_9BACT|nr:AAA family ATPase [Desulfosarcina ovata]BBO89437.1 hypothetical protein DSCOOX_26170 [Desulfosarcina ovata subsp. ovata]